MTAAINDIELAVIMAAQADNTSFTDNKTELKCVRLLTLTAVIEAVQLEQVTVTELHTLANDITESWDLGDDGGLGAVAKGVFTVVHHGAVVIGHAQRAGSGVIVGVKVVFSTCRSDTNKGVSAVEIIITVSSSILQTWQRISAMFMRRITNKCCLSVAGVCLKT